MIEKLLFSLLILACASIALIPAEELNRGPSGNYINTYNYDSLIENDGFIEDNNNNDESSTLIENTTLKTVSTYDFDSDSDSVLPTEYKFPNSYIPNEKINNIKSSIDSNIDLPSPELAKNVPLKYLSNKKIFNESKILKEPLKVYSIYGTLEVELSIESYHYKNELFEFNTRAFCYNGNCSIPGPSLFVVPGDVLTVKLVNKLDKCSDISCGQHYSANHTNLYFHGLHIDPAAYNFTSAINGGEQFTYKINIPIDHPPGNHWYHSNVYGYSGLHVMGGLIGAIIVQPLDDDTKFPVAIKSMTRTQLVLHHIKTVGEGEIKSTSPYTSSWSYNDYSLLAKSSIPIGMTYKNSIKDAWFTNNQYQPIYTLRQNKWEIFDIVVASADRMIELELKRSVGNDKYDDRVCDMRLLALDGVYLSKTRTGEYGRHIPLVPGSRASIAVMCDEIGTYYIQTVATLDKDNNYYYIGEIDTKSTQNLVTLNVTFSPSLANEPPPKNLSDITRPSYMNTIKNPTQVISIGLDQHGSSSHWMGTGIDCTLPCFSATECEKYYGENYDVSSFSSVYYGHCTYEQFDIMSTKHSYYQLNTATEINIWGTAPNALPIHITTNHFQFVSYDHLTNDIGYSKIASYYGISGDWRDTWPSLPGQSILYSYFSNTGEYNIFSDYLKYTDDGLISTIEISNSSTMVTSYDEEIIVSDNDVTEIVKMSDTLTLPSLCDSNGNSFYYEETIDLKARTRKIRTNSCPNHFSVCQAGECGGDLSRAKPILIEQIVPLYPGFATSLTDTTCTANPVAYALNGVRILGISDGTTSICGTPNDYNISSTPCSLHGEDDGIKYCGNIVKEIGLSIDKCGGYADKYGIYRYHITPTCLMDTLSVDTTSSIAVGSSPQVAWALDGFPVYGPYGPRGILMKRCGTSGADPSICLDKCNGFYGLLPGIDNFLYRYYFTGPPNNRKCSNEVENIGACKKQNSKCCSSSIPDEKYAPYSIGCFKGCKYDDFRCTYTGERGVSDEYIPKVSNHSTRVHTSLDSSNIQLNIEGENITTETITTTAEVDVNDVTIKYDNVLSQAVIRGTNSNSIILSTMTTNGLQLDELPQSSYDHYITSMVTDNENLYYTTQDGIYSISMNEENPQPSKIIGGLLQITLIGYNFGNFLDDIKYIKMKGKLCTSIIRYNSSCITCMITYSDLINTNDEYNNNDVILSMTSGNTQGVYPFPSVVIQNNRPLITSIIFDKKPFHPYGLAIAIDDSQDYKILYWSNIAVGSYSLHRCRINGNQVENIFDNVQKAYSLYVIANNGTSTTTAAADVVLFVDANHGTLNRIEIPMMTSNMYEYDDISRSIQYIIVRGLQVPTSVVVDIYSNNLFLSVIDGAVLSLKLSKVLSVKTTALADSAAASEGDNTVSYKITTIDLNKGRKLLPSWIKVVTTGSNKSRFINIGILPTCYYTPNNTCTTNQPWLNQRLFTTDINEQSLIISSVSGFPNTKFDLNNGYGGEYEAIYWPSTVVISNNNSYNNGNIIVYVAEYFGKIWKLVLSYDSSGQINKSAINKLPAVLYDNSMSPASSKLKAILNNIRNRNSKNYIKSSSKASSNIPSQLFFGLLS